MTYYQGEILKGLFQEDNVFTVQEIKHFQTETILGEKQLHALCHYLKNHDQDEQGQVITLNDQMLIPIQSHEIHQLLNDLENILSGQVRS
ncbi:hypothetical protein [Rossellomorea aquimaris]|uniref:hypothetical protein n=1 Tax=Rossellomorea aquimaris TaxID=189382 RepID=UPI0007D0ABFE|nr:hypothetical protein [Rossellomorea aquimaris]